MQLRSSRPVLRILLALAGLSAGASGAQDSWEGLTLFNPLSDPTTYLVSNAGTVVHSWPSIENHLSVYLLDDQRLMRTIRSFNDPLTDAGVQIVAWDGTIEWDFRHDTADYVSHHDVEMLPNGNVLMIVFEFKTDLDAFQAGRDPALLATPTFLPDSIIEVQPTGPTTGAIVWEWHIWDHLIQDFDPAQDNFGVVADHPELMDVNYPAVIPVQGGDWNHVNGIAYNADLDQIMLSAHHQDEFWIIDHSTTTAEAAGHTGGNSGKGGDFLYRWGNPESYGAGTPADKKLFGQHNAHWIEEGLPGAGNILVFNNGLGRPAGAFSSLEEITLPVDAFGNYVLTPGAAYGPVAPTWQYVAPVPTDFYSAIISGVQRLPNGNTLACSGTQSRFFEITDAGDIVWEYQNNFPAAGPNTWVFRARRYRACVDPVNYCITSPNSMGSGAVMGWSGTPSMASNDLTLRASGASTSQPGVFFFADGKPQIPFGDGFRCVGGFGQRLDFVSSDAAGDVSLAVDLTSGNLPLVIGSGQTWNFQYWYRDPAFGGSGFNLSDGLEVTFCN